MLKDDYIMNIISQAAKVIAKILLRAETQEPEETLVDIETHLVELVGVTSLDARTLEVDVLLGRLGQGVEGIGRAIFLTDLLRVEADIMQQQGDESAAYDRWLRALDIRLNLAIGQEMINAHLDATIDELVNTLSAWQLPTTTVQSLFEYYEKTDQFDKAENILHELIDDHITNDNMLDEGLSFYERLIRKSDTELRAGNLPRTEVQAGFDELWERSSA